MAPAGFLDSPPPPTATRLRFLERRCTAQRRGNQQTSTAPVGHIWRLRFGFPESPTSQVSNDGQVAALSETVY